MDTGQDIEHLLSRRLQGLTTDEENRLILKWAAQTPENRAVLDRLDAESSLREDLATLFQLVDSADGEARLQRMNAHIQHTINRKRESKIRRANGFTWWHYSAAAIVLIILTFGAYYYQQQAILKTKQQGKQLVTALRPGGNRATLRLSDGRTIDLSEAHRGIVVGNKITYQDGSEVLEGEERNQSRTITQLSLSTPKGGTYQLTLPDDTKVWLNAASTLKYPNRFEGEERIVELEGEAYFDVNKQQSEFGGHSKTTPFLVKTNTQTVHVLGTQFNISAYADEPTVKTTLVQGKVLVASTADHWLPITIQPGEQASSSETTIDIKTVDTEQYIAWKDGLFHFKQTPLEDVMRQASRWYNVEVVYKRGIPKESFTGKISRSASLSELLNILQLSAIDVTLADDKLIVN